MRTARNESLRLALALLLVGAVGLLGCKKKNPDGNRGPKSGTGTVTIAVAGPMTGSAASYGEWIKKGAELAAERINATGGINGKTLALNFQDDKADATEATNVARKIAGDKNIPIVIGHFNSVCTNSAKEEYNDVGVVSLSPGSTNVNVCKGYRWTFRNLYRDDYQGILLARFMAQKLGAKKVAVFYDNDDYGKGLMGFFREAAQKEGLTVLEPIPYQRERTQDFKALVSQVVDKKPDTIFVSGLYNEGALICKAARVDLGMKDVTFVGGDGLVNPEFVKIAGAASAGAHFSSPYFYDPAKAPEMAKQFYEKFKQKYGIEPDTWSALTYDAVLMAAQAIQEVGADRKKILDWMAAKTTREKAFVGVTGPTYFDKEGDCKKPLVFVEVKGGKMVLSDKQF